MATTKLTEKSLAALTAPGAERVDYWDSELPGFGVRIGPSRSTFIAKGRVKGKQKKVTIGVWGQLNAAGFPWTVNLARQAAKDVLGAMANGRNPSPDAVVNKGVMRTLQDGLDRHVADMRKRKLSQRSIDTIQADVKLHLKDWLERPMVELDGAAMLDIHDKLTEAGKERTANKICEQVSAIWNTMDRIEAMPGRNPVVSVRRNKHEPSRKRVKDEGLGDWYAKVQKLSPIRRDLQLFTLFTGMRKGAGVRVKWEDLDLKAGVLKVPNPKGGKSKAFEIPLPATLIDILKERKKGNAVEFSMFPEGDHGLVFPSLSRKRPFKVQPVKEPKEYRPDPKTGERVSILPGLHTLRRTWLSVANDVGVSELDRHVLANHAYGKQNVNASYIEQAFDHLAQCQAKIEAGLWKRIKGAEDEAAASTPAAKRRGRRAGTSRAHAAS